MTAPRTPTLPQVLAGVVDAALRERVHTLLPGKIESFDAANNVADVQPTVDQLIPQEDGSVLAVRIAVLRNVPVVFPGGGGYRITFPVKAGDYCELHFQESSIDRWRSNGDVVAPQDGRRFALADAVCHVGLQPNASPWTGVSITAATFGKDGGPQVVVRESTIELGGTDTDAPTDFVALASPTKSELTKLHDKLRDLTDTFNQNVNTLKADMILLKAHGHTVTVAVAAPSPTLTALQDGNTATGPDAVGDVKSAKIKSF